MRAVCVFTAHTLRPGKCSRTSPRYGNAAAVTAMAAAPAPVAAVVEP